MAESWVRLWAGTTTDPKWQTIARKSGQPRCLVIALFTHLLMIANEADQRGNLDDLSIEDTASALDCEEEQIDAILSAMEGRVIDEKRLTGWDKRQPAREDQGNPESGAMSAAERKRLQRQREKEREVTTSHDESREVTTSHAPEAEAEAEAEAEKSTSLSFGAREEIEPSRKGLVCGLLRKAGMADSAPHYLTDETWDTILAKRTDEEIVEVARAKMAAKPNERIGLKYIAKALLEDPQPITANARASPTGHRRQTAAEEREAVSIALTGRKPNHERPITNTERDITGESTRVA